MAARSFFFNTKKLNIGLTAIKYLRFLNVSYNSRKPYTEKKDCCFNQLHVIGSDFIDPLTLIAGLVHGIIVSRVGRFCQQYHHIDNWNWISYMRYFAEQIYNTFDGI